MSRAGFTVTPVALGPGFDPLALHRFDPARYPVVLESVAHGTQQGRHDIVPAFPTEVLRCDEPGGGGHGFLAALDAEFDRQRSLAPPPGSPPFRGGWFLYLGYELRGEIEASVPVRPDAPRPLALALRMPAAVVRDRSSGAGYIVTEDGAGSCRADIERDLAAAGATRPVAAGALAVAVAEPDPAAFVSGVVAIRERIGAGDLYQANLSRRWHGRLRDGATVADVYDRLRTSNPAPFAGLLAWPGIALASSSPERLVRIDGDGVETRPIAGTRPVAGATAAARRDELLANPKERAEHVMLIDLERNDLGRVCRPGSVAVAEFMVVESYTHVHHIVSSVIGQLRADATPGAIIRAVFPGGTITGCPKVRCLAEIDRVEGVSRGAYTGSMGYLNRDGSADLNILIRTIDVAGDRFSFAAGSGIVADSDPGRELEETRAKARGMLLAVTGG